MTSQSARARASSTTRGLDELILSGEPGGQPGVPRPAPSPTDPPRVPGSPWVPTSARATSPVPRRSLSSACSCVTSSKLLSLSRLKTKMTASAQLANWGATGGGQGSALANVAPPGPRSPRTCASGAPASSRMSRRWLWPSTVTSRLNWPPAAGEGRGRGHPAGVLRPRGWNLPWPRPAPGVTSTLSPKGPSPSPSPHLPMPSIRTASIPWSCPAPPHVHPKPSSMDMSSLPSTSPWPPHH